MNNTNIGFYKSNGNYGCPAILPQGWIRVTLSVVIAIPLVLFYHHQLQISYCSPYPPRPETILSRGS